MSANKLGPIQLFVKNEVTVMISAWIMSTILSESQDTWKKCVQIPYFKAILYSEHYRKTPSSAISGQFVAVWSRT